MNITPEDFLRARRGDVSSDLREAVLKEIAEDEGSLVIWLSDVEAWGRAVLPRGQEVRSRHKTPLPSLEGGIGRFRE
jgi:hypothetical protein